MIRNYNLMSGYLNSLKFESDIYKAIVVLFMERIAIGNAEFELSEILKASDSLLKYDIDDYKISIKTGDTHEKQ